MGKDMPYDVLHKFICPHYYKQSFVSANNDFVKSRCHFFRYSLCSLMTKHYLCNRLIPTMQSYKNNI